MYAIRNKQTGNLLKLMQTFEKGKSIIYLMDIKLGIVYSTEDLAVISYLCYYGFTEGTLERPINNLLEYDLEVVEITETTVKNIQVELPTCEQVYRMLVQPLEERLHNCILDPIEFHNLKSEFIGLLNTPNEICNEFNLVSRYINQNKGRNNEIHKI